LVERGDLGFSDIDADGKIVKSMATAEATKPFRDGFGSDIRKAESVDESMLTGITKDTWLGIPWLRMESDGA
jgi:hypothetical protein